MDYTHLTNLHSHIPNKSVTVQLEIAFNQLKVRSEQCRGFRMRHPNIYLCGMQLIYKLKAVATLWAEDKLLLQP